MMCSAEGDGDDFALGAGKGSHAGGMGVLTMHGKDGDDSDDNDAERIGLGAEDARPNPFGAQQLPLALFCPKYVFYLLSKNGTHL